MLGYKYRGAVINDTIPFPLAFKDQESTLPVTDFPWLMSMLWILVRVFSVLVEGHAAFDGPLTVVHSGS